MRFDIYGRFQLEVVREGGAWVAYRIGAGLREPERDVVIPARIDASEISVWLDDLFHELAAPGETVSLLS